ncbi:uncharacterized [Tachysurus ichikawai]
MVVLEKTEHSLIPNLIPDKGMLCISCETNPCGLLRNAEAPPSSHLSVCSPDCTLVTRQEVQPTLLPKQQINPTV